MISAGTEIRRTADLFKTLLGPDRVIEVLRGYRLSQTHRYQIRLDSLRALRARRIPNEPNPKNEQHPTGQNSPLARQGESPVRTTTKHSSATPHAECETNLIPEMNTLLASSAGALHTPVEYHRRRAMILRRSVLQMPLLALKKDHLDRIPAILKAATASGKVRSATALVRQGKAEHRWVFTKSGVADPVYLLASITKPMTVAGAMILVERGEIKLDAPVQKYIPEFKGDGRAAVTVKHLLTHTSGLPDMLPENEALRKRHAPLADFVAGSCRTPLLFPPGSKCQYQSMGILLAAEIVERITKKRLRDFLREALFTPLGMKSTALGLGTHRIPNTEQCQVPNPQDDWNWNSPYWRDLGAPWGGAHATAGDVMSLLEYFLQPGARVFRSAAFARQLVTNQNQGLNEPWGYGFMVNGAKFSKACSADTFGHWGSTGTVAWADPKTRTRMVLLTTKPASESRASALGPVSDAVAEAASA
ncbi:MAG: beta-lactamase family protein [Acidobacteria bacterium]|nr:beta-lactamase family protein [Acidobacteriota bacterium]